MCVCAVRKTPTKGKHGMKQTDEGGSRKRKQGTQKKIEQNVLKSVSYPYS